MIANARIKKTAKTTDQTATDRLAGKLYKSIDDFILIDREFVLSETVVHPKVQKRIQGVDPVLGAVQATVDKIFDKLDDGHITVERLIAKDPLVICGVLDDQGKVTQYARFDGHTRIPAIIKYKGVTFSCPVKYFEATERELWIASGGINADNATPLSNAELRAMFMTYLEDPELVKLSDGGLSELMKGQYVARNIANTRDALIIKKVLEMVKEGRDFDGSLIAMVKKYAPEQRLGLDGRKQKATKLEDKVAALRIRQDFDKVRPVDPNDEQPTDEPATPDQPAAESEAPATTEAPTTPEPATTAEQKAKDQPNFVPPVGTLDQVSKPINNEPAQADSLEDELVDYPFDAVGPKSTFDGVDFQTSDQFCTVEIITDRGALIVPIATLKAFAQWHDQIIHTDALVDLNV